MISSELDNFDWDNLGFNLMPAEFMYTMKCSKGENFTQGELCRYGNIELSPSACVLNYGQACLFFFFSEFYMVTYQMKFIVFRFALFSKCVSLCSQFFCEKHAMEYIGGCLDLYRFFPCKACFARLFLILRMYLLNKLKILHLLEDFCINFIVVEYKLTGIAGRSQSL